MRTAPYANGDGLPWMVESDGDRDPQRLRAWITENRALVEEKLRAHGAVWFRGFDVVDAPLFEQVVRAIDDDLHNDYLGTSPRNALTGHVFTASELPPYYPIPQHCEMSFTRNPPKKLFFGCTIAPEEGSGETPLCDFRKVWRDLDPAVKARFVERGLRIVRNYAGPSGGGRFDLWKLKRWDEMFLTTDREVIEKKCVAEGFETRWEGDRLRLTSTQDITRKHPVTGEEAWHNHVTTFHPSQATGEYRRILGLRPSLRVRGLWALAKVLGSLQQATRATDEMAMQVTWKDGTPIDDADVEAVREVVWKHLVVVPWHRGDVVAIDNYAVSHGRLPYKGPRQVIVSWA